MNNLQTILITGSSSGFGRLIAQTLVQKGHTVLATMRNSTQQNKPAADALRAFAAGQPGILHIVELDVTDDNSVTTAVQHAIALAGPLDVVINNAGVGYGLGDYAEALTMSQFQHSFDVNVFGVQRVIRAVLPGMRQQGAGLIINISSTMGRIVLPFAASYTATKYALEGLSESYRYELAQTGVDVVIVEPGGFGTEFWTNMFAPGDGSRLESYGPLADLPQRMMWGNLGQMFAGDNAPDPQAVADAVLTLLETPPGQRPLRTVVDPATGGEAPTTVNHTTAQVQTHLLDALGMGVLLAVKPLSWIDRVV